MIIEIDEKDFREIQDRLGDIRITAIIAKMVTEKDCVERLCSIACTAREITALLDSGVIVTTPPETTKYIEHYDYWMCEKCGCERDSTGVPEEWNIHTGGWYGACCQCNRKIIELVPLVREGG